MPNDTGLPSTGDTTIIAEIANAHEGELSTAVELVSAVDESADAVKFQVFTADDLVLPSHPDYDTFSELAMTSEEWEQLIAHARDVGLHVFADVFGSDGVDLLAENGVSVFKIHNADVSNTSLIDRVRKEADHVLLSAGGSTVVEIATALNRLGDVPVLLMYGFQNYPTAIEDANLGRISALSDRFDVPVGYASHAPGTSEIATELPKLAVTAGASAVEVHVTDDRSKQGTDYHSALEPDEFDKMATWIRQVEELAGSQSLALPESERSYRNEHKKWLVATQDIPAGEHITSESIGYKRLPDPDVDNNLATDRVLGRRVTKPLYAGDPITLAHMEAKVVATLACRAESTRLYGKPLQQVGENPILSHLIDRLRSVSAIDDVVLAIADTPSQTAFINYATSHGIDYVIGSEENVLGRLVTAGKSVDADIAVRVTTENPFVYTENIDDLVASHIENNHDYSLTEELPLGTTVEIVSMGALEAANTHGADRHRSELCTLFIVDNADSFSINVFTPPDSVRRPDIRLTVDNPEDLTIARDIWSNLGSKSEHLQLESIIEYLDENPDLIECTSHLPDGTDDAVQNVRPFMYGDADG